MVTQIITKRLVLKTPTKSMHEQILAYWKRNKDFFRPWVPTYPDNYFTEENTKEFLDTAWMMTLRRQILYLAIFLKEDKDFGCVLGDLTYSHIQRGSSHSCFLGYKMDEAANGKGYITEAIQAANEYLFKKWKLHRIDANIMPHNKRSLRVVEKLGFENEGLARKLLKINGKWQDHIRFGLVNDAMSEQIGV